MRCYRCVPHSRYTRRRYFRSGYRKHSSVNACVCQFNSHPWVCEAETHFFHIFSRLRHQCSRWFCRCFMLCRKIRWHVCAAYMSWRGIGRWEKDRANGWHTAQAECAAATFLSTSPNILLFLENVMIYLVPILRAYVGSHPILQLYTVNTTLENIYEKTKKKMMRKWERKMWYRDQFAWRGR